MYEVKYGKNEEIEYLEECKHFRESGKKLM